MKTQLTTILLAVTAFCACGPGAKFSSGKQAAAEALYAMSGPTQAGANKAGAGVDVGADINIACAEGGSANLHGFGVTIGTAAGLSVGQSFTAEYRNCQVRTTLGIAGINGSLAVNQSTRVLNGSVQVEQTMKGKLVWGGAVDDFLDVDVLEKVSAVGLTQTGGGVSLVLKGTISDTSGTYSFDESMSVTPGKISVEVTAPPKA